MALVVETGSGSPDSDSYASLQDASDYATARGLTFPIDGDTQTAAEQALRRATSWIDGIYGQRFPGLRKYRRAQALQWPRIGAVDNDCNPITDSEVPVEVVRATIEAAVRELASPGTLSPDVTPGKIKTGFSVSGAVSVTYAANTDVVDQRPVMTVVDDILATLLGPRPSSVFGGGERA